MPGVIDTDSGALRKRKRTDTIAAPSRVARQRCRDAALAQSDIEEHIQTLEMQIGESRRNYNKFTTLINYTRDSSIVDSVRRRLASLALCRIFSRLMGQGIMTITNRGTTNEEFIRIWLLKRYQEYRHALLATLVNPGDRAIASFAVKLLMRLWKDEVECWRLVEDTTWKTGTFNQVMRALFSATAVTSTLTEFVDTFVVKYDDIRFNTLKTISVFAKGDCTPSQIDKLIAVLGEIEVPDRVGAETATSYITRTARKQHSFQVTKKAAQDAWTSTLGRDLSKAQRKKVLGMITHRVVPWFQKVELLMDFLTDSFDAGGSLSLLALSGLFHLMQDRNLDYLLFYKKLYSLLDSSILHSKHRSRFFRLLDTFLSSTHLPAALVASFVKRLARLCLYSPPSGTVFAVPWIYNLLKTHPACTFMIHKASQRGTSSTSTEDQGTDDPFTMAEDDPMLTNAIESSLWEIETLQSHHHPNVATIANIISEQFTKQAYDMEDFLDHSYDSILTAELSRTVKKAPVVEFDIPKRVFPQVDPMSPRKDGDVLTRWDFRS